MAMPMYGMTPGAMYPSTSLYPNTMPTINPSPFQYPSPSQFGTGGMSMTQGMQTQVQPQQTGPDWIQVPTIQQVEQVSVQPGGKAWIMTQDAPIFALRVADNMGLVTTDYYRFEKIDPKSITDGQNGTPTVANGITREEADALITERLNAFSETFKHTPTTTTSNSRSKKGETAE